MTRIDTWLRCTLVAAAVAGLGACSHSPLRSQWPVPPDGIARAFNPLGADVPANAPMTAIDVGLADLLDAVSDEATQAASRDWGSGDVVTAGGLMAVLGGIAEKIGLVNTGAAIGLIGGSGRARFQYAVQRQAYRKAEGALACVQTQVRLLNDARRVMVLSAGDAAEQREASRAPLLAIDAVNRVRRILVSDLDAVGNTPPTRQELEAYAAAQQAAATKAPANTKDADAKRAVETAQPAAAAARATRSRLVKSGAASTARDVVNDPAEVDAPTGSDAAKPKWLVDEARNIATAYPAELAKCNL